MKRLTVIFCLLLTLLLAACGAFAPAPAPTATPVPTATPEPTPDPAAVEAERQLELRRDEAIASAEGLCAQYFYDEALALLSEPELDCPRIRDAGAAVQAQVDSLREFSGDVPHIFFHSLIVYPELVFTDRASPMGGYNAGFSEKQELLKILPQLYERGYVLYDIEQVWQKRDGVMTRLPIYLPEGKTPLILSVDDVAYAYGDGYANRLFLDGDGQLMYAVKNPQGGEDIMPDGDVMGVVDAFVREHPDFSWRGHKGTIALTGYQGAFGYSYDEPEQAETIRQLADALKAEGWSFASHSYTHNRDGYYGPGCRGDKIQYDVNKWVARVTPCLGETRLFIAPFGYRVKQPALQYILDAGFDIYCTVDNKVYNELNPDYALMSRIEIGGYSMTYYADTLNALFFNVSEVFDQSRPPVI